MNCKRLIAFLVGFLIHFIGSNCEKQYNVLMQINGKDIRSLFTEDEIFGIYYKNTSNNIVEVEVVINESKFINITTLNKRMIMGYDVIWDDIQVAMSKERARINNTPKWSRGMLPDIFFNDYRTWTEYLAFLVVLEERFPQLVSLSNLPGETVEGRFIPVVTLSTNANDVDRPGFYIQAALHSREWLANAATMYILNALAEGYYDTNYQNITDILNQMNIYIVPTVNVDGYIYTHESDRNWRKNRKPNDGGSYGVDLNRNYNAVINERDPENTWCCCGGASTNPTSNTYCGTEMYSEPEIVAVTDFILDTTRNIGASFDMHTSGNMILIPWAYDYDYSPQWDNYLALGERMQAAVASFYGEQYRAMKGSDLYPASGSSMDFAASQPSYNVWPPAMMGFAFEGRGPGFNPSPENIRPGGREQLQSVIVVAEEILSYGNGN